MTGLTAIKPIYDRATKKYVVQEVRDADPLLAHEGFFVFDDPTKAWEGILAARLLTHWPPNKVNAVLRYLNHTVFGEDEDNG